MSCRHLHAQPGAAARRMPRVKWLRRDLRTMQAAAAWTLLQDFDAVVNCAGALQDGAGDNVTAVQQTRCWHCMRLLPPPGSG